MAAAALLLYGVYFGLAFGVRIALQILRTGSTGVRGLPRGAAPVEWLAGGLFVAALAVSAAAPLLALLDLVEPIAALDGAFANAIGLALAVSGIALTFGAQLAMGDAWRIGVDPDERTQLVTSGPFGLVRNPIYSAMVPTILGLALMAPSPVALLGAALLVVALEMQVRTVEEPYLLQVHGAAFGDYASRVGRFVPGTGFLHAGR